MPLRVPPRETYCATEIFTSGYSQTGQADAAWRHLPARDFSERNAHAYFHDGENMAGRIGAGRRQQRLGGRAGDVRQTR